MQFWVYILQCSDGSFYTGHTDNLEARLWQHDNGLGSDWTRRRLPVKFVWADTAPTRAEALEFELRVKKWSRAKKIALIESDWAGLNYWAKKPCERPSAALGTRPSFSLGTNELGLPSVENPESFVPSENEGR